jgi:hypothetical protein
MRHQDGSSLTKVIGSFFELTQVFDDIPNKLRVIRDFLQHFTHSAPDFTVAVPEPGQLIFLGATLFREIVPTEPITNRSIKHPPQRFRTSPL